MKQFKNITYTYSDYLRFINHQCSICCHCCLSRDAILSCPHFQQYIEKLYGDLKNESEDPRSDGFGYSIDDEEY